MAENSAPNEVSSESETPTRHEVDKQLVLTGADIVGIGPEAELLVGGKNYNTALISEIDGIQAPHFRAISSIAFHKLQIGRAHV